MSKLEKGTKILMNSKISKWCLVDVDNYFEFMGMKFKIDDSVEEYKVENKYSETENYTNKSYFTEALVVINHENKIIVYDQNCNSLEGNVSIVSKSGESK